MSMNMLKPLVSMYSLHFITMNTIICVCKDIIKVNYETIKTNDPREQVLYYIIFLAMKAQTVESFNENLLKFKL